MLATVEAAGHVSDVTALSVPRSAQAIKNTAIADWVVFYVRSCREMDCDNRVASRLVYDRSCSAFAQKNTFLLANGKIDGPGKGEAKNV